MKFLRAFFWEFVQNLPLVGGFLLSLDFWRQGELVAAIVCIVAGSIVGPLVIWATESRIVKGHREPIQAVGMNMLAIGLLAFFLVLYMSSKRSGWWSDLVIGVGGGIALGAIQSLTVRSSISLSHCTAFALAFALGLGGVRLLITVVPLGANILVITAIVSAIITAVDYSLSG